MWNWLLSRRDPPPSYLAGRARLDPPPCRQGVRVPRRARSAAARGGRPAGPRPGDPAGVGGRLDHAVRERAPPGGRHRRRRPAAVPLPPAVAGAAGRGEVRPDAAVRQGAGQGPRARGPRPRSRGDAAGAGVRGRRPAARPGLLPDRQRRVRRRQRLVRPDHAGAAARAAAQRRAGLSLRRQVRRRARRRGRRRRGGGRDRGDAPPAYAARPEPARLQERPRLALDPARAGQRLRPREHRPRGHRQGLPHLARHRARRRGAGRDRRAGGDQGLAQAGGVRRDEGGGVVPRQHPHAGPDVVRRPAGDRRLRAGQHHPAGHPAELRQQ